ncbi:MAG: S8 family serine peptidase [Candidatus Zixiibacteriota bacterium]
MRRSNHNRYAAAAIVWAGALLAGVVFTGATADAGTIGPALEQRLSESGPDDFIRVIIRPIGAIPGGSVKRQVTMQYATRAAQHRAAVETLRVTADRTQPAILSTLRADEYRARVDRVNAYWIDNVIVADMTPSAIAEIASRPDVAEVILMPQVKLIAPVTSADATGIAAPQVTVEPGLRAIKADSAWAQGITGKGRLVGSLDTGVDGGHELLSPKWRGHNGATPAESWYDPVFGDTVPRTYSGLGASHGTQVMGIMVAVLPLGATNDTLGVCPDCQWISAAAIDVPCPTSPEALCSDPFAALQWIADPDGDPTTEVDVPDAVANPWGVVENPTYGCIDAFWNAIDNIEAAGAAMFFAAGNYDTQIPYSNRVWNPGNRNTSDVNSFAVGMVNANNPSLPIDALSSRGPSGCDGVTIKPEVVAPGVNVRTTNPNNGITNGAYGTSFATPHVAAAAALLRQYNPNATVDQIKNALLQTARDLGPSGNDNDYGRGIIDLAAALRYLPANTQPSLDILHDYYVRPAPGTSTSMVLVLRNTGVAATDVNVTMTSADPRITITDGTTFLGSVANADTAGNFADPFTFSVDPDLLGGERVPVQFQITADGGYARTTLAAVQIGPSRTETMYTHHAGNFRMTVGDAGIFGLSIDGLAPRRGSSGYGEGYLFGSDATQTLFEGALLVGTDMQHVSDNARVVSAPDADFVVDPGGRMEIQAPSARHSEETRSAFSDETAEYPLGLFIEQRTWVDTSAAADDYLVAEYTMHNKSGSPIAGLRAGLYFDWDFPWADASQDTSIYRPTEGVGWMQERGGSRLRGVTVISPVGTTAYRTFSNVRDIFDGFANAEKWAAMAEGFTQADVDTIGDASHLIATGPYDIPADSLVTVAFAVIGAESEADLLASAQYARDIFSGVGSLTVQPVALQFTGTEGGADPQTQELTLRNRTDVVVSLFDVKEAPSWASADPDSGTIDTGQSLTLTVGAHIGSLTARTYRDTIVLWTSDETSSTIRVPITLKVNSPAAPEAVSPNPFNPNDGPVTLTFKRAPGTAGVATIYDLAGEPVRDLDYAAGAASLIWDGRTDGSKIVADGVYLGRVEATGTDGFTQIFRIVVKKHKS